MARVNGARLVAAQLLKQADNAARLLRVLSNSHRLRVLCLLIDAELSVGQINEMVPVSQSVLSQHLAVLRKHKLVTTRRVAQTIYYSVAAGPANGVVVALHDSFCKQPAQRRRPSAADKLGAPD
jgi:DNA-binding transcriptional ArsR family regulator